MSSLRNKIYFIFVLMFLTVPSVFSQEQKPDSAQIIINDNITKIKSTNRNVLVIFHASWCTWCKWLDLVFETPETKSIMDKYYITAKIDIKEFGTRIQSLENPGGKILFEKFGGKSGLPFIAVLNKNGKMIANSNLMPKNQNIGYPSSNEEIAAFIKLLKKTAPQITKKETVIISDCFKKNAPL